MSSGENAFIRLNNIVKVFPGARALDGVSFDVRQGECHALKLIEIVPQVMAGQKVDYYQASGTNAISKDNIADWTADDFEY